MEGFHAAVSRSMTPVVFRIDAEAGLDEAEREMARHNVSGLLVVKGERPIGFVTRSDLLRRGRAARAGAGRAMALDERMRVGELCTADPVSIRADNTLQEAARLMFKRHVHRVLVLEHDAPAGVLSVSDLLRVVADSKLATPIGDFASDSIAFVSPAHTLKYALDRLNAAQVRALLVMVDEWPVGCFTQADALAARDADSDAPVERFMNPGVLALPDDTPVYRAAAQAIAMHSPLIVSLSDRKARGVLSATDMLYAVI